MNQKSNKMLAAEISTRNRIVNYAPVASTRGDKVKIYRYGFDRISTEYHNLLESEQHPLRKAVIRYEWARFILTHLEEYAGDRELLKRSANALAVTAYLDAKHILTEAEERLRKVRERLHRAEKRAGINRKEQTSQTSKGLTAQQKQEIDGLRYDLKLCCKHQNDMLAICPDRMFISIKRLAENVSGNNK